MEVHANASMTPRGRLTMVRRLEAEKWTLAQAAETFGVSTRTAAKWRARYRAEGEAGLTDRSSQPKRVPHQTPEDTVEAIAALRRIRSTGAEIAEMLDMPPSTVSLVLRRIGLGKLSRLEPPEPPNRYEKQRPGELIHIDVKKLAGSAETARVTGSPAAAKAGALAAPASNTSTSASTTPPAWPTLRSCPMRRR